MNNPQFSIITITFNSEKTIERTLMSVLMQTCTDYEYIIVDGASKDSTMDIVRRYEPLFEGRMKWKSEPDSGIYDAMNKGIKRSTGDIIGIVNSDDWLEEGALNNIYKIYLDNKYTESVICASMYFHYLDGTKQILFSNEIDLHKYAKHYEMGGVRHPATFVSKSLYEKYGLFDTSIRVLADTDLILRLFYAGCTFVFSDIVVTNMDGGGVSNVYYTRALADHKIIIGKYAKSKIDYFSELIKRYLKIYIKMLLPMPLLKAYRTYRNRKSLLCVSVQK